MCYSARVWADYLQYVRRFGAEIDFQTFYDLFVRRGEDPRIRLPKAMDDAFATPRPEAGSWGPRIAELVAGWRSDEAHRLQQALFEQRKRLADAQRALARRVTRTATESQRIATAKIAWARSKLEDLARDVPANDDHRIYPGHYAPVMVSDGGRHVLRPMRYQCRPAGMPSATDRRFPGTYNARRDNLQGFWRGQYGSSHGVMVVEAFYENVTRTEADGSSRNVVLEFQPRPARDMLVACLWSHWRAPGEPDLLSFAAITDEPPPEVAEAGHDRCIVPLRPERLDAWLDPDRRDLAAQAAILDDRDRPYYEHRLAA